MTSLKRNFDMMGMSQRKDRSYMDEMFHHFKRTDNLANKVSSQLLTFANFEKNTVKKFGELENRFLNYQYQLDQLAPQIISMKNIVMGIEQQINQPDTRMEIFWHHMKEVKDKIESSTTKINLELNTKLKEFHNTLDVFNKKQ